MHNPEFDNVLGNVYCDLCEGKENTENRIWNTGRKPKLKTENAKLEEAEGKAIVRRLVFRRDKACLVSVKNRIWNTEYRKKTETEPEEIQIDI